MIDSYYLNIIFRNTNTQFSMLKYIKVVFFLWAKIIFLRVCHYIFRDIMKNKFKDRILCPRNSYHSTPMHNINKRIRFKGDTKKINRVRRNLCPESILIFMMLVRRYVGQFFIVISFIQFIVRKLLFNEVVIRRIICYD